MVNHETSLHHGDGDCLVGTTGKLVNFKPATMYLTSMENSEMSSVTHSVSDRNATVTNIAQVYTRILPGTAIDGVLPDQPIHKD